MLESLNNFLATDTMRLIYWGFALGGTLLFFVLAGLSFLFAGHGDPGVDLDVDTDVDGSLDSTQGFHAFKIFSLYTLLCFCMFFGWGGLLFGETLGGFAGAFILGVATMFLAALVLRLILKLQDPGSPALRSYVGLTGMVYLSIPGGRSGTGIVTVNTNDGVKQVKALSDTPIPTETQVRLDECIDGTRFVVSKLR